MQFNIPRRSKGLMLAVILVAATTFLPKTPYPWLVYNPTESVPTGFYWITRTKDLKVGDLVLLQTPVNVADLADKRRYLPRHVPMLKYIAALSGDRVCASGDLITINGKATAYRRARDRLGRPMPWWNGCRVLHHDELFVLNPAAPLSFDGRYFGVASTALIRGKAKPL